MGQLYYFANINSQSLDIRTTPEAIEDEDREITVEQHEQLFEALNKQCIIFEDLTFSEPRPSVYHTWNGKAWVDDRTVEDKLRTHLAQFQSLTRRQFKLALLENNLLETVEQTINTIEDPTLKTRIQIEYNESERFERSNQSVQYMLGFLNLTAEQVDEMWQYAMTL